MAAPSSDTLAIIHLLKRERFYRDTADFDQCRAAFHPQADKTHIDVAWYKGEIEEFLAKSKAQHKGRVNIIHSGFDPISIQVSGDRAISEAFCSVTSGVTLNGVDYELCSHMRLFTRLMRLPGDGEWRMLSLESTYVRDRLVTAFPQTGPALEIPKKLYSYPKPYRMLAMVMLSRGMSPRTDLPHEDDPASIKAISEQNIAFLSGTV